MAEEEKKTDEYERPEVEQAEDIEVTKETELKAPTKCPYCGGKVLDHGRDCYSCETCHREFGPVEK